MFVSRSNSAIYNHIARLLSETKAHIKKADELTTQADTIKDNKPVDAANIYWQSAREYELTFFTIKQVQSLGPIADLPSEITNETKMFEEKVVELNEKAASNYQRAAGLLSGGARADSLGMAAHAYLRLSELTKDKRACIVSKDGGVFTIPGDTPIGRAIKCYDEAKMAFYDLGEKMETEGKFPDAFLYYGCMGDSITSIALLYEQAEPEFLLEDNIAGNYHSAGKTYAKSGILSRQSGIYDVVAKGRIEWRHAVKELTDFFKDNGYSTLDDVKRGIKCYKKAVEYYDKLHDTETSAACSREILNLSSIIKEPLSSIRACQEICRKIPRFAILPINMENKNLNDEDRKNVISSSIAMLDDPKESAFKSIDYLLPKLRQFIQSKLSSSPNWFEVMALGKLTLDEKKAVERNYTRETGKNSNALKYEANPLDYFDIDHLKKVILDSDNWNKFFESNFKNKDDISSYLNIIGRIRHPVMHVRGTAVSETILPAVIWVLERIN